MNATIQKTEQWVKKQLLNESTGHDWYHIDRVTKLANHIAQAENGDRFIVTMAALLHDLADDKVVEDEEQGISKIKDWLSINRVEQMKIEHILDIIQTISFKGGLGKPVRSLEGKIVQDADRLDALGAIGIARTFVYAGSKGSPMYDPTLNVRENMTLEQYRHGKSSAIHHFYEKLLKLKDQMNTVTGKKACRKKA